MSNKRSVSEYAKPKRGFQHREHLTPCHLITLSSEEIMALTLSSEPNR